MSTIEEIAKRSQVSAEQKARWKEAQEEEHGRFALGLREAEVRVAHTQADELEDRIKQRKRYAFRFVLFAIAWLGIVLTVVLLDGCTAIPFEQNDIVLVTLIGTGTAQAIAPAILVAKYFFGVPKNGE